MTLWRWEPLGEAHKDLTPHATAAQQMGIRRLAKCNSAFITEGAGRVRQVPKQKLPACITDKYSRLFANLTTTTRIWKSGRLFVTLSEGWVSSYPGTPPASMWLASVTSCDHTSYCHLRRPITPHRTFPEWTPTRMLMSTPVASRTFL